MNQHAQFREWLEQERKGTFEPPGFGDHNYRIHLDKIIGEFDKLPDVAAELEEYKELDAKLGATILRQSENMREVMKYVEAEIWHHNNCGNHEEKSALNAVLNKLKELSK